MQNDRNFVLFIVLAGALVVAWMLLTEPAQRREAARARAAAEAAQAAQSAAAPAQPQLTRAQALAASPRVAIDTPSLSGSISLTGARIDDLSLKRYHEETSRASPPVQLLSPQGAPDGYFAVEGWVGANLAGMPDQNTRWVEVSQGPLTDTHPLELSYSAPSGLVFHRQIKVDPQYLFTVTDTVTNGSGGSVSLAPAGAVERLGVPATAGQQYMEGAIGMFDSVLKEVRYPQWKKNGQQTFTSTGGWVGVTDKYWMTVFVPPQSEPIHAQYLVSPVGGVDDYETSYVGQTRALAPGATLSETTHIFAGAKVDPTLEAYSKALGTPRLEDAIDWGWFSVVTKPIFALLSWLKDHLGSLAWAVLALTLVIRGLFFPVYNASFSMSTKMKKVQPEMKALQEKYKSDPAALQKEMMGLYQREKINPVTGCIPALLPIPVFISLSQLFGVTIEMRHAPFFGWIQDMSAPDPTTIWNLFGLIPWDPGILNLPLPIGAPLVGAGLLHIGAWPAIYAVTMWLSMSMTPTTSMDPTQQKIMQLMPLVFTFFMAHYAVGLLIYWSWSSVFTIVQSYVLMRRFKVDNPIDSFLSRLAARKTRPKDRE
jgi:YidC/Oxa1 family membrane protein insertase